MQLCCMCICLSTLETLFDVPLDVFGLFQADWAISDVPVLGCVCSCFQQVWLAVEVFLVCLLHIF